jgi:hypothetical protein
MPIAGMYRVCAITLRTGKVPQENFFDQSLLAERVCRPDSFALFGVTPGPKIMFPN